MQGLWPSREKQDSSYPSPGCSQSREVMGGEKLEAGPTFAAFPPQAKERRSLISMAGASIHPTPPCPGFLVASVQPRVWNSIQEQAWQTLFFISMETRACNRTRTPCLKCQNSLTHFSPFLQKTKEVCLGPARAEGEAMAPIISVLKRNKYGNLWICWCYRTNVRSQTWIVLPKGLTGYAKSILRGCPHLLEGDVQSP